jgi:hypothetical protein
MPQRANAIFRDPAEFTELLLWTLETPLKTVRGASRNPDRDLEIYDARYPSATWDGEARRMCRKLLDLSRCRLAEPGHFAQIRIYEEPRHFDSVTSQAVRFVSFLALGMLLDKSRRTTMPRQAKNPETPIQQNVPVTTSKDTKVGRLADEAAGRAAKRQQRYDQEHDIFTK